MRNKKARTNSKPGEPEGVPMFKGGQGKSDEEVGSLALAMYGCFWILVPTLGFIVLLYFLSN